MFLESFPAQGSAPSVYSDFPGEQQVPPTGTCTAWHLPVVVSGEHCGQLYTVLFHSFYNLRAWGRQNRGSVTLLVLVHLPAEGVPSLVPPRRLTTFQTTGRSISFLSINLTVRCHPQPP